MAAALLLAAGPGTSTVGGPEVRHLTVCLTAPADRAVAEATTVATRMFAGIGITTHWERQPDACPLDGIRMAFWRETPRSISPGAFGRAFPIRGVRADVFLDRVRLAVPDDYVSAVAGHVLAHEIAHLLQSEKRHATHGLMKPRWDPAELDRMPWVPLGFTDADVDLIHRGMVVRSARLFSQASQSAPVDSPPR